MKTHPVGAELFHADGETDMTKLRVVYCNFVNVPKKRTFVSAHHTTSQMIVIFKRDYFLCSLYAMPDMKFTMFKLS